MNFFKLTSIWMATFLLMITIFSISIHADEAIINSDRLNVRSGPGTHFEKINQVHTDDIYPIIQLQDEWIEIDLGGLTGWVTTEYVTIKNDQPEDNSDHIVDTPASKHDGSVEILNENTHLREGPSTDYPIVHFAHKMDVFKIISEDEDWYEVEYDDGTAYLYKKLVKQIEHTNHLKGQTIVIDAGHGGRDVGSISVSEHYEKDFTLTSALALEETLTILGAKVIMTRTNDDYIRLASRPALSNLYQADAFMSIHYNSFPDVASVSGMDTYYYDDDDQQLAQIIQQEVVKQTGADNRGIVFGNYQVLRQNLQPAILLELGFLSNYNEEQLLLTNTYQQKIVQGITSGLSTYLSK